MERLKKQKKRRAYSVSSHELAQAERRWQKELDRMKLDATQDSTRLVQALIYLALLRTHPTWTWQAIAKVQQEADRISDRIVDPADPFSWADVYAALQAKGVGVEGASDV